MKKQNLKSLKLNKKLVSNLQYHTLQGGRRGTDDITNCGSLCMQEHPDKTFDGCDTLTTHTSINTEKGSPSNCDV